jgi:hypothetical protein
MKNPFEKENHNSLIAAVLLGSVAAGAIAYMFLSDKGAEVRIRVKKKLKALAKDKGAAAINKKTNVPKKVIKAVL